MNKNHISLKAFFLTLLLGCADPTMVMGADEAAPSMMIDTIQALSQDSPSPNEC